MNNLNQEAHQNNRTEFRKELAGALWFARKEEYTSFVFSMHNDLLRVRNHIIKLKRRDSHPKIKHLKEPVV